MFHEVGNSQTVDALLSYIANKKSFRLVVTRKINEMNGKCNALSLNLVIAIKRKVKVRMYNVSLFDNNKYNISLSKTKVSSCSDSKNVAKRN